MNDFFDCTSLHDQLTRKYGFKRITDVTVNAGIWYCRDDMRIHVLEFVHGSHTRMEIFGKKPEPWIVQLDARWHDDMLGNVIYEASTKVFE